MSSSDTFIKLLLRGQCGDGPAQEALYTNAFGRLHHIARALLAQEYAGHTLQPTALVNELYLRFARATFRVVDRDHFFRIAARCMRQVLADHGRRKRSSKRVNAVDGDVTSALHDSHGDAESAYALNEALVKLHSLDPAASETFVLRAIHGFTIDEVCRIQKMEAWQVRANYDYARQWLAARMARSPRRR